MKFNTFKLSIVTACAIMTTAAFAEETTTLDPIVVGADFREQNLSQTASSVSIIGEDKIYDKASQSFVETLLSTPNVNFTAGASKAKYIQIRGIGERSQFVTPINPSVGIMVDGIDFSQSALGLTLFDVKQIEVLRGPQGTTFGTNGMAGVINVESNEPTNEANGHVEGTVGNYNTKAVGIAINAPIVEDKLLSRFSIYKNTSDGYMTNSYLGRDDTNNIDELSAKAKFRWFASDNHTLDLTLMHVNVANGYDAFTLDNTRDSHSDQPGKDTQKTDALALKSTYQVNPKMHLISSLSYSESSLEYSYDEDWSNTREFDASLYPYIGFDQYLRDRKQVDIDVRMVSDEEGRIFNGLTDWTMGAYYRDYSDDLNRDHTGDYGYGAFFDQFNSVYQTQNKAIYGQLDTHFTDKLTLITGLRIEQWDSTYGDSDKFEQNTDENLYGGKIGLNYQADTNMLYYTTLSKGYKPGGVNADNTIPTDNRIYETETLWNLDAGVNSNYFDNTLVSRFNVFYGKRKDQQVKIYIEQERSFTDYLNNAAKGTYYGVESELDYSMTDNLHLYTKLGLLKAEFDEYTPEMTGRAPAQSPEYQYNVGFDYGFMENWTFRANVLGMGSYYFSNTHDQESDPYTLLNSSIEYVNGNLGVTLWGRNLTDTDYDVRGFYFGNDPSAYYDAQLYTQKGTPQTIGLTLSYDF